MKKRLLSAFLAVMMVLTMVPAVFAADETADTPESAHVSLPSDNQGDFTIDQEGAVLDGTDLTYTNGTITVTAADVTIKNLAFGDMAKLVVNTSGKFTLTGCKFEPNTAFVKDSAGIRTAVNLNVGEAEVTDNTFAGVTNGYYNAIEFGIGASQNDLSNATISGNIFNSAIKNNYFNFYNMADNAQINIVNNKMLLAEKSSNGIRISNFRNAKGVTFNIDNDEYTYAADSEDNEYEGLILLQDYSSGNDVQDFSDITVNVTNLTAPKDAKQLLYVYDNQQGIISTNQPKLAGDDSLTQFYAAKIDDTYYATLADAYAALPRNVDVDSEPTTVTLLKDAEGKAIGTDSDKGMNYVIDFGGHTYTVGKPAVGSTGTETQGLRVLKGCKAVFKNGTLKAANYHDMKMPVHTYGDVTFENFTVDASEDSYAQVAYEVDNGSLKMLGNSSILAYPGKTGLYVAFWPRGGYVDGTTVTVDTTGKITGKLVYEWDDKADVNEQQKENKAVLNIANGKFDITGIQTLFTDSIPSELKIPKISISGGYFTTDPSAYCVAGKTGVASGNADYPWTVGEKSATKAEVATGAPAVEASKDAAKTEADKELLQKTETALAAAKVAGNGVEIAAAKVANDNKVTANEDVVRKLNDAVGSGATAENTNIVIQTYMDMKITNVDATAEQPSITIDIQPMYRTVATTANVNNNEKIVLESDTNAVNAVEVGKPQPLTVTGKTTIVIQLPEGFADNSITKLFVQHRGYEYEATVSEDNGAYIATFENPHGFSEFTITKNSQTAAKIKDVCYTKFEDAVTAAKDNETVYVIGSDTEYKATISGASKTIKVENGKDKDITVTINNTVKTIKPQKTAEFTYTKPSSSGSSGGSSSKTTYKVATSSVANGGVNVSPSSSAKGDKVKITLSPNKGYKLDKLTVTDASGKTVSTTKTSDTVYTFTMPASQVTVGVTYVKADETTEQPSTKTFSDVASTDWFADAVKYVSDKGMMNGTGNGKFSPADSTTRGMLMTVIARYAGQDTTGSNPWYQKGMEWAKANGVSDGTAPNANITREQLVTMLYRYAKSTGKDVSVGEDTNILSYADATTVSEYAIPAMQWACGAGIVNGANGKLNPQNNATRAEVAAILMRFCENIK